MDYELSLLLRKIQSARLQVAPTWLRSDRGLWAPFTYGALKPPCSASYSVMAAFLGFCRSHAELPLSFRLKPSISASCSASVHQGFVTSSHPPRQRRTGAEGRAGAPGRAGSGIPGAVPGVLPLLVPGVARPYPGGLERPPAYQVGGAKMLLSLPQHLKEEPCGSATELRPLN